jgi:cyclic pyranopterin phosphate synthase
LYLCLFASQGHDLRALVRGGASDDQVAAAIAAIWQGRDDRYSQLRAAMPADLAGLPGSGQRRVEMSYIGG